MTPFITSVGHFHPPNDLDNAFFEKLEIGSDSKWIQERTGILNRRSVMTAQQILALKRGDLSATDLRQSGDVMMIDELAAEAWKHLLSRAACEISVVDHLICGTSYPDWLIPANASVIAHRLGLTCSAFDVNSACSSFVTDLHVARGLLALGEHRKIAIFNPERYTLALDFSDRSSCILFGDGAAAALIELLDREAGQGLEVLDSIVHSDPSGCRQVTIELNKHFYQNGSAVQKFAVSRTVEIARELCERNGFQPSEADYFIGHQANLRMLDSARKRLGFHEDQHLYNVDRFGNQGASGAPAVLSTYWDLFKPGQKIVVAVVGSGLTWGAALLKKV